MMDSYIRKKGFSDKVRKVAQTHKKFLIALKQRLKLLNRAENKTN